MFKWLDLTYSTHRGKVWVFPDIGKFSFVSKIRNLEIFYQNEPKFGLLQDWKKNPENYFPCPSVLKEQKWLRSCWTEIKNLVFLPNHFVKIEISCFWRLRSFSFARIPMKNKSNAVVTPSLHFKWQSFPKKTNYVTKIHHIIIKSVAARINRGCVRALLERATRTSFWMISR